MKKNQIFMLTKPCQSCSSILARAGPDQMFFFFFVCFLVTPINQFLIILGGCTLYESGSFRPWAVLANFGGGSFRPL